MSAPETESVIYTLTQPVFLVGFMGAGKTSMARKLARRCGAASYDLDRYIERSVGYRISEIFENEGEAVFRQLETQMLRELAEGDPAFIACGGGIVESSESREILKNCGFTLYMKVSVDEAKERISDLSSRPVFRDLQKARERSVLREPLYESVAKATIDTSGARPGEQTYRVRALLKDLGVLRCEHQG